MSLEEYKKWCETAPIDQIIKVGEQTLNLLNLEIICTKAKN